MRASMKWPIRALAMTGMVTVRMISSMTPIAAILADIGRHALERHNCARAGILGDLGLLGVGDVHDDASLQHLRQPDLYSKLFARKLEHVPLLVQTLLSHGCTRIHTDGAWVI